MMPFLYENIGQLVTMQGVARKKGRHITHDDLGIIEHAAIVIDIETQKILWLGKMAEIPAEFADTEEREDCGAAVWLPELVECHTHLVFAGERHHDYAQRVCGKTYQQIAEGGGGILSTMKATREASQQLLVERALSELDRFQKYGVGCVEIKSGYGLTLESEIKQLEVIQHLREASSVHLVATFLPAHAVPPEFHGRADDYVRVMIQEWIPEVADRKLASFFDVFIENGFFSLAQAVDLCEAAKAHGFGIKIHGEQFTDLNSAKFAAQIGAASIDHLDHVSTAGIEALAKSNTVAVLLPGASLFVGTPYAPARALLDAGACVALSTDFNPGTCPSRNLPLMTTLACSQMKMTVPEALAGITYNAAAALKLENEFGVLDVGRTFRVTTLRSSSVEALPYSFGELD